MALGALLLIGVGVYVWWTGSGHGASAGPMPVVGSEGGDVVGGGGPEILRPGERPGEASSRRVFGDGGVPHVGVRTDYGSPNEPTASGVRPSRGIPREALDEGQSSGWRLGQARRRIAILEDRERVYQAAVDRFVADGNEETAARQRVVLERVQSRLVEIREDEARLAGEAAADGTMGDVDTGYEEGERGPSEPIQGGTTAPR